MFANEWEKILGGRKWNWFLKTLKMHGLGHRDHSGEIDTDKNEEMIARILTAACEVKLVENPRASKKSSSKDSSVDESEISIEEVRSIFDSSFELINSCIKERASRSETTCSVMLPKSRFDNVEKKIQELDAYYNLKGFETIIKPYEDHYVFLISWR